MNIAVIPADVWKRSRDRIARHMRRNMRVMENNPGAHAAHLRYDYILTAAEATAFVEDVMRDTERLVLWCIERNAKGKK